MYSEYQIYVNVTYDNDNEEEVEVIVDLDNIYKLVDEFDGEEEIIRYIKNKTKEQYKNVKEVNYGAKDYDDLMLEIENLNDTSDMHPNETFEEFMEHENFD